MEESAPQADQALLLHPTSIRLQQYRNDLDQDPPKLSTILHPSEGIPTGSNQVQDWTAFLTDSSGHQMLNSLQRLTYKFNDTFSTRIEIGDRYLSSTRSNLGNVNLFSGIAELRELGRTKRCTVMCAEAVWWRCHRRIIADYLIAAGEDVLHILGANRIEPARMTSAARPQSDRTLAYP